ncbi:MAG: hypothetical protein ABIG89_06640 [Candidatus Woesearchaeota archaeon]
MESYKVVEKIKRLYDSVKNTNRDIGNRLLSVAAVGGLALILAGCTTQLDRLVECKNEYNHDMAAIQAHYDFKARFCEPPFNKGEDPYCFPRARADRDDARNQAAEKYNMCATLNGGVGVPLIETEQR